MTSIIFQCGRLPWLWDRLGFSGTGRSPPDSALDSLTRADSPKSSTTRILLPHLYYWQKFQNFFPDKEQYNNCCFEIYFSIFNGIIIIIHKMCTNLIRLVKFFSKQKIKDRFSSKFRTILSFSCNLEIFKTFPEAKECAGLHFDILNFFVNVCSPHKIFLFFCTVITKGSI